MTIEDGSSLSQSQTHLEVFENLVESDAAMLADIVNNKLLPLMVKHGFPLEGMRFAWDDSIDYTPEQQHSIEQMLLQNYDVEPKFFEDKYGIPCAVRTYDLSGEGNGTEEKTEETEKTEKQQKHARPFFD